MTAAAIATPVAGAARLVPRFGYAISAVGFRSYFAYHAHRGETISGVLRVVSLTPVAKTIVVDPADVSTASTGGLQYGDTTAQKDGRWLRLDVHRVHLSGSRSAAVPFTLTIPAAATSGEHFAAITAVDRRALTAHARGRGAIRLRLIPRLAMTTELRLPGPLLKGMSVGRSAIAVASSGASLALPIANSGNTLITTTTGTITISQNARPLFSGRIALGSFVPRTAITYHLPWHGTPTQGIYHVRGTIHPAGTRPITIDQTVSFGNHAIKKFQQQTGRQATATPATPGILILLLTLAIIAAAGFAVAYVRARKRLSNTTTTHAG
jgi:hypothetical protein